MMKQAMIIYGMIAGAVALMVKSSYSVNFHTQSNELVLYKEFIFGTTLLPFIFSYCVWYEWYAPFIIVLS